MVRGTTHAYAMHLTGHKVQALVNTINHGGLGILNNIDMSVRISQSSYLEDETRETRTVTVIELGLPVTAIICFYL